MAVLNFMGINPRSFRGKLILLGATFTTLIVLYTYAAPPSFQIPLSKFSTPLADTCTPEAYSSGSWRYHPGTNATSLTSKDDVLGFAGFSGCASSREYYWHLAADEEKQWNRFPGAHSWEWVPSKECRNLRPLDAEALVKDLVEDGGWFLVGDSVTENHFFSISCLLYPHVIATPDYNSGSFDRGWIQNMYLNPESPLVDTLTFPSNFNITTTPLVTFRRIDILLSQAELNALYHLKHPEFSANDTLFSDEAVWTWPVHDYIDDIFLSPLANYKTMVISTGGHWTTSLFSHFYDEEKKDSGYGIDGVLELFEFAMQRWAAEVQTAITKDQQRMGVKLRRNGGKRVVVRAYLPGHENCHDFRKPWTKVQPYRWNWYNWSNIWDFNARFQKILSDKELYPSIHFLPIDRPARLRPDAHAAGDCLHIMTGAGVLEGWTHYIWQFISKELRMD